MRHISSLSRSIAIPNLAAFPSMASLVPNIRMYFKVSQVKQVLLLNEQGGFNFVAATDDMATWDPANTVMRGYEKWYDILR